MSVFQNKNLMLYSLLLLLLLNACGGSDEQNKSNPISDAWTTEPVNIVEPPFGDNISDVSNPMDTPIIGNTPSFDNDPSLNGIADSLVISDTSCLPNNCSNDETENNLVLNTESSSSVEENVENTDSDDDDSRDVDVSVPKYKVGSFTDSRDKKKYRTVTIGNRTWMGENLNYENPDYSKNTNNFSYCYANEQSNCAKYGRLYLQKDLRKDVCPDNWHLPTKGEFEELIEVAGGKQNAGKALRAPTTWKVEGGNNEYGFMAKASGYVIYGGGSREEGLKTMFWSNDMNGYLQLTNGDGATLENFDGSSNVSNYAFSIRCVLGPEPEYSSSSLSTQSSSSNVTQKVDSRTVVVSEMEIGEKSYKTTTIGTQTWMAENMNNEVANSECYEKDDYYCKKYGRLYTYEAAKQVCSTSGRFCGYVGEVWACTTRVWRLPTMDDWKTLIDAVGGENSVPEMLRESNLSKGNAYSFSILFAGVGEQVKDDLSWTFDSEGKFTAMWSAKSSQDCTCSFEMDSKSGWNNKCLCRSDFAAEPYNDASLYDKYYVNKYPAYSVRCVMDAQ